MMVARLAPPTTCPTPHDRIENPANDQGVGLARHGKTGLVRHMLANGANVADVTLGGKSMLELALDAQDYQTVMLLIDQLKATGRRQPMSPSPHA